MRRSHALYTPKDDVIFKTCKNLLQKTYRTHNRSCYTDSTMMRLFTLLSTLLALISGVQGFHSPLSKVGIHPPSISPSSSSSTALLVTNSNGPQLSRRQIGELSIAAIGLTTSYLGTRENTPQDYGLWGVLPVGPYKRKKTIMETIVPNSVWTFDQKFGILNVQVPLRMTVIKLDGGGLFVYDPIAATPELLGYMKELEQEHGPVKHIVLGSVAIEHKVYAGVFAQKFKNAQVWVQPGQYAFPQNLPIPFLGFPVGRTNVIPFNEADAPSDWQKDFEFRTLGPLISKDGAFGETVFYHKPTKTLLVTDTVLEVTNEVPKIFEDDPKPLLYHARTTVTEVVEDTPEIRERGWRRVVLFGLFFTPGALNIKDADVAFAERRPDINSDFAGIYPWDWVGDDIASFKALQGGLLVAPILQQLILNREP